MPKKILYQKITLLPSLWTLDVWVGEDNKKLSELWKKHYGASKKYYLKHGFGNYVAGIESTNSSLNKGHKVIVMNLKTLNLDILVHELHHVLHHYCENTRCEFNYKSQEWSAILNEHLFRECKNKNNYTIINA